MITESDITAIVNQKLFGYRLKVKKVGKGVYSITGYHYGAEEVKQKAATAKDTALFLNQYFGYSGGS